MLDKHWLASLVVIPLAACTTSGTTPLFDAGPVKVEIYPTNGSLQIEQTYARQLVVSLRAETGCATLGDATGTFDGLPLTINDPGTSRDTIDGTECDDIALVLDNPPMRSGQQSIVIGNGSKTWTIAATDMFDAQFTLAGTIAANNHVAITWPAAPTITGAPNSYFELTDTAGELVWTTFFAGSHQAPVVDDPTALTIQGDVLEVALPATLAGHSMLSFAAERELPIDVCIGPSQCSGTSHSGTDFATP